MSGSWGWWPLLLTVTAASGCARGRASLQWHKDHSLGGFVSGVASALGVPETAGLATSWRPWQSPRMLRSGLNSVSSVSLATSSRGTEPGQAERPGLPQPCLERRHTSPGHPLSAQKHPTFDKRNKGIETPKESGVGAGWGPGGWCLRKAGGARRRDAEGPRGRQAWGVWPRRPWAQSRSRAGSGCHCKAARGGPAGTWRTALNPANTSELPRLLFVAFNSVRNLSF